MKIIEKKKQVKKVSIALEGEMTVFFIKDLKNNICKYLEHNKNMELDLSKISRIDTSGFQLLALLKREVEGRASKFKILNPSDDVKRIFSLYQETI